MAINKLDPHFHAMLPSALLESDDWPRESDYEYQRRIGAAHVDLAEYGSVVIDDYRLAIDVLTSAPVRCGLEGSPAGGYRVYELKNPVR